MKYLPSNSSIHVLSRALIRSNEKIVLCRVKGKSWFFLPGGHVENGETAPGALLRELNEELRGGEFHVDKFLGTCENFFKEKDGSIQQEINLIFEVHASGIDLVSQEGHIEFIEIEEAELPTFKLLPQHLKEGLISVLGKDKSFYSKIELSELPSE